MTGWQRFVRWFIGDAIAPAPDRSVVKRRLYHDLQEMSVGESLELLAEIIAEQTRHEAHIEQVGTRSAGLAQMVGDLRRDDACYLLAECLRQYLQYHRRRVEKERHQEGWQSG